MEALKRMLDERDKRLEEDQRRFEEVEQDKCMACGAEGPDKRSLYVSCFYDMKEAIPDFIALKMDGKHFFYLRICKACRAALLQMFEDWWKDCVLRGGLDLDEDGVPIPHEDSNADIPVRIYGSCVWVTEEEWKRISEERRNR